MTNETVYKAQQQSLSTRSVPQNAVKLIAAGSILLVLTLSGVAILPFIAPLLFVSGIGALLMMPAIRSTIGNKSNWSFLAAPGASLVALGAMFFVLNLIGHLEGLSYLWTVLPISFVVGMMFSRRYEEKHPIHVNGERVIRVFSIIGMTMGVIFELFVFETFGRWWPVILIGYGIYLLTTRRKLNY
ncbi:MAG: hypothetical protein ACI9EW_003741 [Cellvibrionaceae bacterium]|jgi:hypothetical protein